MTGPRPIGEVLRDRHLQAYFQCCCKLRGRPAGQGAAQDLTTALTYLDSAARQGAHLGPIAGAAERAAATLRRPSAIERAFPHLIRNPEPPRPGAA